MKIVSQTKYVHLSAINQFPVNEQVLIYKAINAAIDDKGSTIDPDVISFTYNGFDAIINLNFCDNWDSVHEPSIIKSVKVIINTLTNELVVGKFINYSNNPLIYHGKHFFVNEDYKGFDPMVEKIRYESFKLLKPDKNKMGRCKWWTDWCIQNNF